MRRIIPYNLLLSFYRHISIIIVAVAMCTEQGGTHTKTSQKWSVLVEEYNPIRSINVDKCLFAGNTRVKGLLATLLLIF